MHQDPYEVLGIARDATLAEATAAYRRLAQLFHPDRLQGLAEDVQAEGAQRLREVTAAMRVIRSRFGRPLTPAGRPGVPTPSGRAAPRPPAWAPSDEATAAEAHIYDVDLHALDGPEFHVRWHGAHAAATLAALRHEHRIDGPIHQIEWGAYEIVLDGAAMRRLLSAVLAGDAWRHERVDVVRADGPWRDVGDVADALDENRSYALIADVY